MSIDQKIVAHARRSAAVKMTLPSGGTGTRRSFAKSKIRGAPVTVYVGMVPGRGGIGGAWIIVSSCILIGLVVLVLVLALALAFDRTLVTGPGLVGRGRGMHHWSINRLFSARTIEMTMILFPSPLKLVSCQCASALTPLSNSE
jgi:hypothetical protein